MPDPVQILAETPLPLCGMRASPSTQVLKDPFFQKETCMGGGRHLSKEKERRDVAQGEGTWPPQTPRSHLAELQHRVKVSARVERFILETG